MITGSHIHWLRNYMSQMQGRFNQLHHLVGSHIEASDRNLNRINGKEPINQKTPNLEVGSAFSTENLYDDLISAARSTVRKTVNSTLKGNGRSSDNQMMSDFAASIMRAMTRNS